MYHIVPHVFVNKYLLDSNRNSNILMLNACLGFCFCILHCILCIFCINVGLEDDTKVFSVNFLRSSQNVIYVLPFPVLSNYLNAQKLVLFSYTLHLLISFLTHFTKLSAIS